MNELLLLLLLFLTVGIIGLLLSKYLALKSHIEARAQERYAAWCDKELQTIRRQYEDIARKQAVLQFQQWTQENEAEIRKDAVEKGLFVISPENFAMVIGYRRPASALSTTTLDFRPSLPSGGTLGGVMPK